MLHIPILHTHDVSKQIPREKKFFHRVENVTKQLVHTSAYYASSKPIYSINEGNACFFDEGVTKYLESIKSKSVVKKPVCSWMVVSAQSFISVEEIFFTIT